MSKKQKDASPERAPVSDHLTVRPEGSGPAEVHFLFERREKRLGGALGASVVAHGCLLALWLLVAWLAPDRLREAILPDLLARDIIWLVQPGPGGGGGGGNRQPEPPKKAELEVPKAPAPEPKLEEPPPEVLNIPARTLDPVVTVPGILESTQASASTGSGPGTGGGAGQGSGLGPGTGGGIGGGIYRPGSGVLLPRVLREVKPQYTAEAMRAKVQGVVLLECVVLPDGTVGSVEIIKSLDPTWGLDQEAVKAARQWRFAPGTRYGEPVAVLVTIELTFTLR